MIEMHGIKKIYELGDEEVHALDGVDLTIRDREFVAIIGASGSGKSTLMNIMGCLDTADEGTYKIDGEDVTDMSEHDQAILRNRKIGFIFQQFNLLMKLTAYENVELPLIYQGVPAGERRSRTEAALERVGLKERMHHRPNQLSGGQQQRVAVARALVTNPSLILADEPTGNLDSRSSADIMKLLKELHGSGNTLVLITHDNHIAAQAPRRVQIFDGRIIADTSDPSIAAAHRAELEKISTYDYGNAEEDGTAGADGQGNAETGGNTGTDGQRNAETDRDAGADRHGNAEADGQDGTGTVPGQRGGAV